MPIKKRTIGGAPVNPAENKFPEIIAKPKKPVANTGIVVEYVEAKEDDSRDTLLRLPKVAETFGEDFKELNLTVADRVQLVRTPFDPASGQEQRYRNRIRNRQTAITAMCVQCVGTRKNVTECIDCTCPLWPFRMGGNPYRKR